MALFVCSGQWTGNGYHAEPGAHGDEPAHLVTGLMLRDWAAAGFPAPMRYAEDYYLHYPKVAIGHWPPFFYVVQAAWWLAVPPSTPAAVALIGLLAVGLGWRVRTLAGGGWSGLGAALFLLAIPVVRELTGEVMAEILLMWLCLEAVHAFTVWMKAPGGRAAAMFALWSVLAILTKVTALCLAALPLALLPAGRRALLGRKSLWAAGLAVAALTAPWYLVAPGARHEAAHRYAGVLSASELQRPQASAVAVLARRAVRAADAGPELLDWMGPGLLLALWGLWRARGGEAAAEAAAVAALVAGMLVFRFLVTSAAVEPRTLVPLLAPLAVWIPSGVAGLPRRGRMPAVVLLCAMAAWNLTRAEAKPLLGTRALAAQMAAGRSGEVILICSDAFREGAFIAEMAAAEPHRPGRYVLRATKLLATSDWSARHYRLNAADEEAVLALLEKIPVDRIVYDPDHGADRFPHHALLGRTLERYGERFRRLEIPAAGRLRVYELAAARQHPPAIPRIHLFGLGRSIGAGQ